MLDPYVRATLGHDGAGRFAALVKVPDSYGVFKWVLTYRRLGYSYIELTGAPLCLFLCVDCFGWRERICSAYAGGGV